MAEQPSRESASQIATAEMLYAMLRAIDPSARLDLNDGGQRDDGRLSYEVRIYGRHVGFVYIRRGGSLGGWV